MFLVFWFPFRMLKLVCGFFSILRTKDRGPPGLMKLSPNKKLAILQRQKNSVDVVMLEKNDGTVAVEFNVPTKSKDMILSVDWITNNQILFVTKQSLEIFSLNEEKGTAKLLRNLNVSASWSIYYAKSSLIILATGNNCTTMQPFLVQYGQFTRLKVLLHFSFLFLEIIYRYGKICVMVLRYSGDGSTSTDLLIYELSENVNSGAKLKYSLTLGKFSNISSILRNPPFTSTRDHHSIRPTHSPLMTVSIKSSPVCQPPPALYVPLWSMFQPDIVVDPVAGMMYQLTFYCDRCMLIEFLIHRTDQKVLVLSTLLLCLKKKLLRLRQIRRIFNLIVEKSTSYLTPEASSPAKPHLIAANVQPLRIEQREMHSNIFIPFMASLYGLLDIEHSLCNYLLELVVESLALSGEMIKLHQLVTYRVISDSKPLAFLLLSYEARCPPLFQAGLDILARCKACDEIVEVLLERRNVIDAISELTKLYTEEEIKSAYIILRLCST
ncbi:unnamed protein product [Angiostrongylus costaricensis]|uniref:Mic1 domain-containing protein n=1 Tax=Angiostrongylus costaricensis TaxID=334426 RepID=A0A158PHA0_ANGCS|nr:unnamed protein product [Angiostrongylus costaricensis]